MRNVEIEIFLLAKTQVQEEGVKKWLTYLQADACLKEVERMVVDGEITDPALLIALAAKRCYMAFEPGLNPNVEKVRKDFTLYLDNILKSGHGSVLEHAVFTFAIEGVSRVFTGEMNRHRAGVGISEGSMRYIRYRDIPCWLPTSIRLTEKEEEALKNWIGTSPDPSSVVGMAHKKMRTQNVFEHHYAQTEENYARLQEIWKEELAPDSKFKGKKEITSMIRRIIPMGVATGGVWTLNMRALRHVLALRASSAAEEEILHVFSRIGKMMVESEPMLLGDFSQTEEGYWIPKYGKV